MSWISSELCSCFSCVEPGVIFSSFSKRNLGRPVVQKVLKLGAKVPGNHEVPFCPRVFEADLQKRRSSQLGSRSRWETVYC